MEVESINPKWQHHSLFRVLHPFDSPVIKCYQLTNVVSFKLTVVVAPSSAIVFFEPNCLCIMNAE